MDFFSIKETAKKSRLSPPTHTSLHDPCTRWSEGHELRPGTIHQVDSESHLFTSRKFLSVSSSHGSNSFNQAKYNVF